MINCSSIGMATEIRLSKIQGWPQPSQQGCQFDGLQSRVARRRNDVGQETCKIGDDQFGPVPETLSHAIRRFLIDPCGNAISMIKKVT